MHKTYYNIVLARRTTFLDYFLLSMHIFCYNSTRGAYYLFWPLVLRTWKNRNLLFFSDRLVLYHTILTLACGWLESPGHLEDATSATALVEEKARHHVSYSLPTSDATANSTATRNQMTWKITTTIIIINSQTHERGGQETTG